METVTFEPESPLITCSISPLCLWPTGLYGRTTPTELMRTLYSNGFLSREQFERLRESYKIRSQVVHGLVPPKVDPELVHYVTATARYLVSGEGAAVSSN